MSLKRTVNKKDLRLYVASFQTILASILFSVFASPALAQSPPPDPTCSGPSPLGTYVPNVKCGAVYGFRFLTYPNNHYVWAYGNSAQEVCSIVDPTNTTPTEVNTTGDWYPCAQYAFSFWTRLAPPNNYSIELQNLSTIEPKKSLSIYAKVTDSRNQTVSGATVRIKVEAVPGSGGHNHGDNTDPLRRGKLSGVGPEIIATRPTGADGLFSFTFDAPEVSGTYKFTAWCNDRTCAQKGANTLDVKVAGLLPLPASVNFFREIGTTTSHPDNHYLTQAAIDKAQTLAYYYKDPFSSVLLLRYNDASLIWGGRFDLDGDWLPSHNEHQRGTVIDVRANRTETAIPVRNYKKFEALVKSKIGGSFLHENVGTTNEHYHVRLLNKAE